MVWDDLVSLSRSELQAFVFVEAVHLVSPNDRFGQEHLYLYLMVMHVFYSNREDEERNATKPCGGSVS